MVGQSDQATSECKAMLSQALGRLNARLADLLKDLGFSESAHEAREELIRHWSKDGLTPAEDFRELDHMRRKGLVGKSIVVRMVFGAREEAERCLHDPSEALDWLLQAEWCLGYFEALSGITQQSEQKSHAAKKSNSSQTKQALQADVLAFIEQHQPPEGWTREQAIENYVQRPFESTNSLVHDPVWHDKNWADMGMKITRWLHDPEFRKPFDALLKR